MAIAGDLPDVGFEHVWKAVKSAFSEDVVIYVKGCGRVVDVAFLGTAGDGDGSAVHVHLTVSDLVEPGPRESVASRLNVVRDGILKLGSARAVGIAADVASSAGRASSLDGEDDLEGRVFGRLHVFRQSDLTASATVRCASGKGECLRAADGHFILLFRRAVHTGALLARVVAPRSIQRAVVQRIWAVGIGGVHCHVRRTGCNAKEDSGQCFSVLHFFEFVEITTSRFGLCVRSAECA